MTSAKSSEFDGSTLTERELVEWLGRMNFRSQQGKIPDPASQPESFEKWVDDTITLLHAPRHQLKAGLLGWDPFGDITRMIGNIANTIGNIGNQVATIFTSVVTSIPNTLTDIANKIVGVAKDVTGLVARIDPVKNLRDIAAKVGGIIRAGVEAISASEAAMVSFVSLVITNNLNIARKLRSDAHVQTLVGYFQNASIKAGVERAIQTELNKASGTFRPLLEHVTLLRGLETVGYGYADRFAMAANSILKLVAKISPNAKLFGDFLAQVEILLFGKQRGGTTVKGEAEALGELLVHMLINMNPILGIVVRLMSRDSGNGLLQKAFPMWIQPGMLNGWINGEPDYAVYDPKHAADELAFRRELVAAFDQYMRSESASYGKLLRGADQRGSAEALLDVTGVFCSTVFGFVLRAPGLPSPCLPKLDFANPFASKVRADDIGDDVAATLSRQIVQPMKSVLGVVLNGVWAFSPNNQPLVEVVTGFLAHIVRSLLEFLMHDLFWSFEIHETYRDDQPRDDEVLMFEWQAGEASQDGTKLVYRVYRREGILAGVLGSELKKLLDGSETLKNLLKDYAAYREAVREYSGPLAYGVVSDQVKATTELAGKTLTVKAEAKWKNLAIPSLPVLRAYYDGSPIVLVPKGGDAKSQNYEGRFDNASGDGQVWIRSNYGGSYYTGLDQP